MRTEAQASEHARRDPDALKAQQTLGGVGMAIIGDPPGRRYLAVADDAPILACALPEMRTRRLRNSVRELLEVLLQIPGARRSETPVEFHGLGTRWATLLPLGAALPWVQQATFPTRK
jgi:hypothetical protein